MRLTVIIFSKMGSLLSYHSELMSNTQEVDKKTRLQILLATGTEFNNSREWPGELEEILLKDSHGWTKTRHNTQNGQRAFIIFYGGK